MLTALLLLAGPAFGAAQKPHPKLCGVYAKYVCGGTPKPHHKVCGVYVKYDC